SSQHPKQVTLQRAKSTWYGCQVVPGAISAVLGSKPTTREMSIPVPTFRHTPFVVGNFENGGGEATAKIKGGHLVHRIEKTLLVCSHGPVGRVRASQRRA